MEFTKKIGWARPALVVSALLMIAMGVVCFTCHDILPEALHNPRIPEGYTWPAGELFAVVVGLVAGISQIGAWKMAGGTKAISGYLLISGVMCCTCALGALIDPFVGTFCFEWVVAVFGAFTALGVFFGALGAHFAAGYKGMIVEMGLAALMIIVCLGVVYDSAYASVMAGIFFILYGFVLVMPLIAGNTMKLSD